MSNSRAGTTFGHYEIRRLLGKGGMGEVYEAFDTDKERVVALKILADHLSTDESFRLRFQRESHVAARLAEPHFVPIHDWGDIDGTLYIDMRLVRGMDLRKLLENGPLEPARAVSINSQIAAALDAAHADGLIHRDVKPENILVTSSDFAYLVDFGIAAGTGDTHLTNTGSAIGSVAYMAPERFDTVEITPAVDTYSLACVLHQSLTGASPYPSRSLQQVIAAHISAPAPRPSNANRRVPPSFDDVISRGMAKNPRDRYASAGAFALAAQGALRGSPVPPPPDERATLAAHHVPAPPNLTKTGQPMFPPVPMAYPSNYPQPTGSRTQSNWVVPAVIAVAVALLVVSISVIVVLLNREDSGAAAKRSDAPTAQRSRAQVTSSERAPQDNPPPPPPPMPPPLFTGPDPNNVSCDTFSRPGAQAFGSRAGRGSDTTTCQFAQNTLDAYWNSGPPTRTQREVSVPGTVDCRGVPGNPRCAGANFVMACAAYGNDDWITCEGGYRAKVFIF